VEKKIKMKEDENEEELEQNFQKAVEMIKALPKDGSVKLQNEQKLKLYSLYKQATEGPCSAPKPPFYDIIGKAKWEVWKELGEMSKMEAQREYLKEVEKLSGLFPEKNQLASLFSTNKTDQKSEHQQPSQSSNSLFQASLVLIDNTNNEQTTSFAQDFAPPSISEKEIVEMQVKVVNEMETIKSKLNDDTLKISKLETMVKEQLGDYGEGKQQNNLQTSDNNQLGKELKQILEQLEKNIENTKKARTSTETLFANDFKQLKETEEKMLNTLKSIEKSINSWRWFSRTTTAILLPLCIVGGVLTFNRLAKK